MVSLWPLKWAVKGKLATYSDRTLTVLLLVAAGVIILIALFVRSPLLKAIVLAYIVLP